MTIKHPNERLTHPYQSSYESTITKEVLENDMYLLHLSQREIARKYNVGKGTIQNLQYRYGLEILNMYQRRVPQELTDEQKQLVYGTIIADGHIFRKSDNRHGALKICHTTKKEPYVDYKYNLLKEFVRTKPTIQVSEVNGSVSVYKTFRTLTHIFFTDIHKMIYYKENEEYVKHLNVEILEKQTPYSLAIAYMDDGTKHHYCRDFCFECFCFAEQQLFCDWLKDKFTIEARVMKYRDGFRTRILRPSVSKFVSIIAPYLLDCFKYKL